MAVREIAVAWMLLAAGTAGAMAEEPDTSPPHEEQVQWTEFKAPERGFAASFPSAPKIESEAVAGQNPLIRRSFQAYDGDDTVYTVVVLEYPEGKAPHPEEGFYIKMVSAYAKESSSRVRKRGAKTIAGKDGYEAITDESGAKLNHQVSIVPSGDRIYMLITAGPRGHVPSDDADRFRDSFRLIGQAPESTGSIAPTPPAPAP
jgi:hypothetical protein